VTTRKQATAAGFFMRCSAAAKIRMHLATRKKRTTPLAVASGVALTPLSEYVAVLPSGDES
jgi:hypothetical protein